jgi:cation-transporting P-type ATPase 13A2
VTVILKRALDLFTISIPPALPVAMTIGVSYAVDRLQKEDIYCIAPSRVNVAGRVTTMCFDKTGTLTEDGLSVLGVHPGGRAGFAPAEINLPSQIS